jgi:hypothetical protein
MAVTKRALTIIAGSVLVLAIRSQARAATYDGVRVTIPVSFLGYTKASESPTKFYAVGVTCTVNGVVAGSTSFQIQDQGPTASTASVVEEYKAAVSSVSFNIASGPRVPLATGTKLTCQLDPPAGFAAASTSVLESSVVLP